MTPHSGENKVRVVQTDHTGQKHASKSVAFKNENIKEPELAPKKVKKNITFTSGNKPVETKYEIYDAYGNIVKKGVGSEVDCSNLAWAIKSPKVEVAEERWNACRRTARGVRCVHRCGGRRCG